jgi:hypothetical protein
VADLGQPLGLGAQHFGLLPRPLLSPAEVAFRALALGAIRPLLPPPRLGDSLPCRLYALPFKLVLPSAFGKGAVGLLGMVLGADLRAQLVQLPGELVRRHLGKARAQRLAHRRGLGADPLGRFADVLKATAQVGRLRGDLLPRKLHLGGGVEERLLAGPRGGDVELLLGHRGVGHHERRVQGRPLGLVDRRRVGVLDRRRPIPRVDPLQEDGIDTYPPCGVDSVQHQTPGVNIDLRYPRISSAPRLGSPVDGDRLGALALADQLRPFALQQRVLAIAVALPPVGDHRLAPGQRIV